MYLAQRNVALKLNEVNFFNIFSESCAFRDFNQLPTSLSRVVFRCRGLRIMTKTSDDDIANGFGERQAAVNER